MARSSEFSSVWEEIDRELVQLKLNEPLEMYRKSVESQRASIWEENRDSNLRTSLRILEMIERRTDEWIRLEYETYCAVWGIQKKAKSPEFLRTLAANIIEPSIRARVTSEADYFVRTWERCGFSGRVVLDAQLQSFRRSMQLLEDRWKRRLETEAREMAYSGAPVEPGAKHNAQQSEQPQLTNLPRPSMEPTPKEIRDAAILAVTEQHPEWKAKNVAINFEIICNRLDEDGVSVLPTWQHDLGWTGNFHAFPTKVKQYIRDVIKR